jgi:hypothetical protein
MSNKLQRSIADAQQFLEDALASPSLAQGYHATGQKARGQSRAASLLEWLSSHGYHTTPTHILHALEHLRDSRLSYWAGIYGETTLEGPAGSALGGPPLVIVDDEIVLLDNVPISDFQFSSRNLVWGRGNSRSAGSLRFDEIRITDGSAQSQGSSLRKAFNGSLVRNQCEPDALALPFAGRVGPVIAVPLDNWSGAYATWTTWTGQDGAAKAAGPQLIVQDRNLVLLDGSPIRNFSYSSAGHTLNWGLDCNTTAGCLVFGNRPGSGNQGEGFSGTMQMIEDGPVLSCQGELSYPASLSGWVGVYGQTVIEETAGRRMDGPELAILIDGQMLLDGRRLQNLHYEPDTQVLTWPIGGNGTGGRIAFQQDSGLPFSRHAGKRFQGALQRTEEGPAFPFSGIPGRRYSGGGSFQEETLLKICMDKACAIGMISRITLPYRQNRATHGRGTYGGGTKPPWSGGERIAAKRRTGKDIETY